MLPFLSHYGCSRFTTKKPVFRVGGFLGTAEKEQGVPEPVQGRCHADMLYWFSNRLGVPHFPCRPITLKLSVEFSRLPSNTQPEREKTEERSRWRRRREGIRRDRERGGRMKCGQVRQEVLFFNLQENH